MSTIGKITTSWRAWKLRNQMKDKNYLDGDVDNGGGGGGEVGDEGM